MKWAVTLITIRNEEEKLINIRLETKEDYFEVEKITRKAFWNLFGQGCDEHLIVHNMRQVPAFIKELAYIITVDDVIVGNVMYTNAKVVGDIDHEVLTMGPISITPEYQKQGLGEKLLRYSLDKAKELGYEAVVIYGNPDYYKKYGFVNAESYNIKTHTGENFPEFMALELITSSLDHVSGLFYEDEVFKVDSKQLEEFEKLF